MRFRAVTLLLYHTFSQKSTVRNELRRVTKKATRKGGIISGELYFYTAELRKAKISIFAKKKDTKCPKGHFVSL